MGIQRECLKHEEYSELTENQYHKGFGDCNGFIVEGFLVSNHFKMVWFFSK